MNALNAPGPGLAGARSTLDLPFHPDLGLLANAVESFFSKMTRHHIRFCSIADLRAAINAYLAAHMPAPNPSS